MKPVAIVIPWFGRELKGGAEQHAWQVAVRLRQRRHLVEVLTTCCRAFQANWSTNHFTAGTSEEQGVVIRRFPVDVRDRASFDQVNARMLSLSVANLKPGVSPVLPYESDIFARENINSSLLLDYLREYDNEYQAFIFTPYLYGPILNGLPIVADRAFLQPCLHDEIYAYLPEVERCFRLARRLLFISEGEAILACRLYGPGVLRRSIVVGGGVEVTREGKRKSLCLASLPTTCNRFVLYLGRRDPTKNVDLLVRAYSQFKRLYPSSSLKLVLAGPGVSSFRDPEGGVYDLGLVGEREKEALLTHCVALFQPSRNESYSRVIMEAWLYGRPVAAHKRCLATALAVERAQGGWLAETEADWAELFAKIQELTEEELEQYGANGQRYANEHAVWEKVIDRYEQVLGLQEGETIVSPRFRRKLAEIHQLLPNLAYGDAISNQALAIRNHLRCCGYDSQILVRHRDQRVAQEAQVFQPGCLSPHAGLIYHHSTGSALTPYAIQHQGPKCLVYHNITPAEFFAPYRPALARVLANGRVDLRKLAHHFPYSAGVSAYNAAELVSCGFRNPHVLPIAIDPNQWNIQADEELMRQFQDGVVNLLFVGRFAPNKRQEHLVEAFAHYLSLDSYARLILVGGCDRDDPYCQYVLNRVESLGLTDRVIVAGLVTDSQLIAYYRTAHLLWSMSEHEGFCVPAVEAMWFDVPVLAYKSTAVPETLGGASPLFTSKDDLLQVAALAKLLVRDEDLRAKVCAAQRKRRMVFLPEAVWRQLEVVIARMEELL